MSKRSHLFLVAALLVPGCAHISPSQRDRTAVPAVADPDLKGEAVQAVRAFFAALDRRDTAALEPMFLPDAVIVSDTGMATNVEATMRMIRSSSFPQPQARETYDFQVHVIGEAVVVGFLNRIALNVSGKPVERLFNETWVFVRVGGTLKLLRAHYSVVPVGRDRS
jgi:ketosteroid isomerase-like protein